MVSHSWFCQLMTALQTCCVSSGLYLFLAPKCLLLPKEPHMLSNFQGLARGLLIPQLSLLGLWCLSCGSSRESLTGKIMILGLEMRLWKSSSFILLSSVSGMLSGIFQVYEGWEWNKLKYYKAHFLLFLKSGFSCLSWMNAFGCCKPLINFQCSLRVDSDFFLKIFCQLFCCFYERTRRSLLYICTDFISDQFLIVLHITFLYKYSFEKRILHTHT